MTYDDHRYRGTDRHMWDRSPATLDEQYAFSDGMGIYADEILRDQHKRRDHNHEKLDETRWGDSKTATFVFGAAVTQFQAVPQILHVQSPGRVWSIHLAMTLQAPAVPVGDSVNAFIKITAGVGSSVINFSRTLQSSAFIVNPLDPTSQPTTDIVVPDIPAREILVNGFIVYAAAAAETMSVRIDAHACPVMR